MMLFTCINLQEYHYWLFFHIRVFLLLSLCTISTHAQVPIFSHQDTLRGSVTKERQWWDLTFYHLDVEVNPADSSIKGVNTIQYRVLEQHQIMQVDLQPPMNIEKVVQNGIPLQFNREGNAYFIRLADHQNAGAINTIDVFYSGKPKVSEKPPWRGGLIWQKDIHGNPFVATACQGDGASLWWPCKDHLYDEPDSMLISVEVPEHLMSISNGRLRKIEQNSNGTRTYHWFVSKPISNYTVNINVGDYVHFSEKYQGEKGSLDCHYYVLKDNLHKAKEQFKEVKRMLEAFEYWFGPYPFYEDSYKLVEVPYLGMEHQSSVTYGNGYQNGYKGRDLSGTGWGLQFDFILVHESGHEWFGNSITCKDIADMWIHESFTAYSENLFLDYHFGKEASAAYVLGTRSLIKNDQPVIGYYDVNHSGSKDMYYKGANMLHTLRQIVNDDEKWRKMLRGLNQEFYHQTVTIRQIKRYLSHQIGWDLTAFFNQYLQSINIPMLEYRFMDDKLTYRWSNCVEGFDMPVKVYINGREMWLKPTPAWAVIERIQADSTLEVDANFYVGVLNLTVGKL